MIAYDRGNQRYMSVAIKILSHRSNNYWSGGIEIMDMGMVKEKIAFNMLHDDSGPRYGAGCVKWSVVDVTGASMGSNISLVQFDPAEQFDVWLDWRIVYDFTAHTAHVIYQGVQYPDFTISDTYGSLMAINLNALSWFTGSYSRFDDLVIQSSDSPL